MASYSKSPPINTFVIHVDGCVCMYTNAPKQPPSQHLLLLLYESWKGLTCSCPVNNVIATVNFLQILVPNYLRHFVELCFIKKKWRCYESTLCNMTFVLWNFLSFRHNQSIAIANAKLLVVHDNCWTLP